MNAETSIPAAIAWSLANIRANSDVMSDFDDEPTRIDLSPHPVGMVYPAVMIDIVEADDTSVFDDVIIYGEVHLRVQVCHNKHDLVDIAAIYAKIHRLLQGMAGTGFSTNDYGTIVGCSRVEPVYDTYTDKEDTTWRFIGGIYKVSVT